MGKTSSASVVTFFIVFLVCLLKNEMKLLALFMFYFLEYVLIFLSSILLSFIEFSLKNVKYIKSMMVCIGALLCAHDLYLLQRRGSCLATV